MNTGNFLTHYSEEVEDLVILFGLQDVRHLKRQRRGSFLTSVQWETRRLENVVKKVHCKSFNDELC